MYKVNDIIRDSGFDCGCRYKILKVNKDSYQIEHTTDKDTWDWDMKDCDTKTKLITKRLCAWCESELNDDSTRGKQLTKEEYKKVSIEATHGMCKECNISWKEGKNEKRD